MLTALAVTKHPGFRASMPAPTTNPEQTPFLRWKNYCKDQARCIAASPVKTRALLLRAGSYVSSIQLKLASASRKAGLKTTTIALVLPRKLQLMGYLHGASAKIIPGYSLRAPALVAR